VVKKPRTGQASFDFHMENLHLPGEKEDTEDELEAEAEPGPSVSGARGSRKRARTEEAHASGMDCQFVTIERGGGLGVCGILPLPLNSSSRRLLTLPSKEY